jgi:hypothetical protein
VVFIVRIAVVCLCLSMALAIVGCSSGGSESEPGDNSSTSTTVSEQRSGEASAAARARGLPAESKEAEGRPVVTLDDLSYEWRQTPQEGLEVLLKFGNSNDVFERARAYVFVVAWYSAREASSTRVYPTGVDLDGGLPSDYTDGTHILYRKDESVNCFLNYGDREGYFDRLKIIVYSEEGDLLINQEHSLDVNGEPAGRKTVKPVLAL